ncbi:hypothetical protein LTR05_008724 [Lithohypha guttulata]|uniref:DUF2415 domain-containing protein n=1 Tax=Lithohypha guttulata TaxID=1690604 RepID=A0AAN7SEL5_9EURO|nr:hypothetical protein LTR05_008724 [Lithohypha guttulata]
MTVDPLCLQLTTSLVHHHRYYPVDIDVSHPQLRNFISTVYQDKIFYVNRYDVYILDLESNERSVLVTIPFEARCLAAAHGWVCVGGETRGDCAFVYIGEHDGQPGGFCHELLVEMLGKEIVNSMTVQILKPDVEGYEEETVVLISNNDRTVTIYSLTQRTTLNTINYPQPMNYAVLCPDTTIMAAVGDENKVYFRKRILVESNLDPTSETKPYASYGWRLLSTPDVPKGTLHIDDFSFAVAFSQDGSLCAVSSQGGVITIFDMNAIAHEVVPAEHAILCSFTSTRDSPWGCVRSMAFSPSAWGILAWAEDHGRIGLADLRQGFLRRQHVELHKDKTKEVHLKDNLPADWRTLDVKERLQRQHHQRMQVLRGQPPLGARSFRRPRANGSSYDQPVVMPPELDAPTYALESTTAGSGPSRGIFSINYVSEQPRVHPSASRPPSRREYDVQLLNPSPSRSSGPHMPRRRSSVVFSEPQTAQHLVVDEDVRLAMTASPGPISDDGRQSNHTYEPRQTSASTYHAAATLDSRPYMSTNDLTPTAGSDSSQPLPYDIPPSDPWHVIEASLATNRARRDSNATANPVLQRIENAIVEERQLADRLERQLTDEQRLSAVLRTELEARDRLLDVRNQQRQAEQSDEGELSPSLERLLQPQLHSERDHTARRSEELEAEIRNMSRRVNQLIDERDVILQRQRTLQAHAQAESSTSSALSSALPTVSTSTDQGELNRRIQSMSVDRRMRAQRIQNLEHEVRRAESRVELAQLQNNIEHTRARTRTLVGGDLSFDSVHQSLHSLPGAASNSGSDNIRSSAIPESRRTHTSDNFSSLSPTASAMARRLRSSLTSAADPSSTSTRATIPRISELANTSSTPNSTSTSPAYSLILPPMMRIPDNDIRIARLILARSSADGNGNWTPAAGHRYLAGGSGATLAHPRLATTSTSNNNGPGLEDIIRDAGPGTAGIGWSPDGLKLFAATEKGIFEFELNVQDRMQCPMVEFR